MKNTIIKLAIIKSIIILIVLIVQTSNSNAQGIGSDTIIKRIETSETLQHQFTGFVLYDPELDSMICEYNSAKYFTPASNTKLFSFFSGLMILGDSLPALKYIIKGDSLIFSGTADPSFLNLDIEKESRTYDFLKQRKEKLFYSQSIEKKHFGTGWAWDDYNDYYSAEKALFPIYGNIIRFSRNHKDAELEVQPKFFAESVNEDTTLVEDLPPIRRELCENKFTYYTKARKSKFERDVPFKYSKELMLELLSDTLNKKVSVYNNYIDFTNAKILYSMPSDTLYKRMMQVSDNFMAEHILLMCSFLKFDALSTNMTIDYVKDSLLNDLPDEPIWVDGSGLSRYNLFTPRTMVALLKKINNNIPDKRLFKMLAAGGESGTIKNWYKANKPYIYAKTGTLSNNHCLSGFLFTHSGKKLIFTFMNNHYITKSSVIKKEMEKILWEIHAQY